MKALLEKIRKILRSRRTRQLLTRTVSGIAAIVVFVTTYALVLPAITLEQDAFCGIPEHQHTDTCYEERLVCEIPEGEGHQHDASCYEKFLICGQEVHIHSTECFQQDSSAVVSSGSTTAASTAFGAFAEPEPDVYETGGSEYDADTSVTPATDSSAGGESVMEEPLEEEADSPQVAAGESGAENLFSQDLDAEGTDAEKAGEAAADGNLEAPGVGSSANMDADTVNPENLESQDSDEDKTSAAASEEDADSQTERVNNEGERLDLESGDNLNENNSSGSASGTSDSVAEDTSDVEWEANGSTADTANREAKVADTAGTQTEETDSAGTQTEESDSDSGMEEAANDSTTNVLPESVETEKLSSGYVPELDSVEFGTVLNKHTDFYYFHPEEGQEIPASSAEVTEWKKVKKGLFGSTKLESTDLVKMYLSYTIPAGALNETNQVARYRLPSNIHLTDDQIIAINGTENGMSALYADAAVKEDESMADEVDENAANYQKYLGAEAIEGTRTPDETLKEGAQEYISAIVKAENVFDEEGLYGEKGAFLGQDLIFIFTPYSIEKNQTIYNADEDPLSAGEKITGWFACDFNMSQIDWVEEDTDLDNSTVEKTAEVVFAEKDNEKNVKEISRKLKLVDTTEDQNDAANGGETAAAVETAAAAETAAVAETATAAETAAAATTASETAATDETALASTGITSEQAAPEDTENGPFKSGTLTADGDGYRITLDYTEEAKIPENAELFVREITAETDKEAYEACLEQAGQQIAADEKTSVDQKASRFFDIEILVKDTEDNDQGETHKVEPAAPVSVNIQIIDDNTSSEDAASMDKEASQSEPAVLHFAEEGVEQIDSTVKTNEDQDDNKDRSGNEENEPAAEISFEAESFSIYGVVYTVDFHWEVDGETFEYSLDGGDCVSFRKLVEVLGVMDTANSVAGNSEKSNSHGTIDEFIDDVEKVAFSDESLVKVARITEGITAGALKEKLEIKSEYSAELTETQIEEIDSQIFHAPDWALISLKAFTSEEALTVTMKTGEVFTIAVTDAQIKKTVIDAKGETWEITVTYDDQAGIPDGADLEAKEIAEGTAEYQRYFKNSVNELRTEADDISFARFFDITIVDKEGNKVEPETPVTVQIEYKNAIEIGKEEHLSVVHFADKGTEVIDNINLNEACTTVTYTQDSFSVTGTVVNNAPRNGQSYMLIVDYEGEKYIINNDGTLIPVSTVSSSQIATDNPMLWTYNYQYGGNFRIASEATGFTADNVAAGFYYRYIDPNVDSGLTEEDAQHPNLVGSTQVNYNNNLISSARNNNLYIGVSEEGGTLHIVGNQQGASKAAKITLYNPGNVNAAAPANHSVNHIDVSISGDADVDVPLAYGIYYYKVGETWHKLIVGKDVPDVTGDDVEAENIHRVNNHTENLKAGHISVTSSDMKSATITAKRHDNGAVVNDAFYITGYSANHSTVYSTDQVRIEGSFKVADMAPVSNDWWTVNSGDTRSKRLQNIIDYTVSADKRLNLPLTYTVGENTYALFKEPEDDADQVSVVATVNMSATFNYWDHEGDNNPANDGNECPPLQPGWGYDGEWRNGGIHPMGISGMDFVLHGKGTAVAKVLALEITKTLKFLDENGSVANVQYNQPITFDYEVFTDRPGDPSTVRVPGGEVHDYGSYRDSHSVQIPVKQTSDGKNSGHVYDYDVTDGMYYVREVRDNNFPNELTIGGDTYRYVSTNIKTEYSYRHNQYRVREDNHHQMHEVDISSETADLNSIPEVLGEYTADDGQKENNEFLEFYFENVYRKNATPPPPEPITETMEINLDKKWQDGDNTAAPTEGSVTFYLRRKVVQNGNETEDTSFNNQNNKYVVSAVDGWKLTIPNLVWHETDTHGTFDRTYKYYFEEDTAQAVGEDVQRYGVPSFTNGYGSVNSPVEGGKETETVTVECTNKTGNVLRIQKRWLNVDPDVAPAVTLRIWRQQVKVDQWGAHEYGSPEAYNYNGTNNVIVLNNTNRVSGTNWWQLEIPLPTEKGDQYTEWNGTENVIKNYEYAYYISEDSLNNGSDDYLDPQFYKLLGDEVVDDYYAWGLTNPNTGHSQNLGFDYRIWDNHRDHSETYMTTGEGKDGTLIVMNAPKTAFHHVVFDKEWYKYDQNGQLVKAGSNDIKNYAVGIQFYQRVKSSGNNGEWHTFAKPIYLGAPSGIIDSNGHNYIMDENNPFVFEGGVSENNGAWRWQLIDNASKTGFPTYAVVNGQKVYYEYEAREIGVFTTIDGVNKASTADQLQRVFDYTNTQEWSFDYQNKQPKGINVEAGKLKVTKNWQGGHEGSRIFFKLFRDGSDITNDIISDPESYGLNEFQVYDDGIHKALFVAYDGTSWDENYVIQGLPIGPSGGGSLYKYSIREIGYSEADGTNCWDNETITNSDGSIRTDPHGQTVTVDIDADLLVGYKVDNGTVSKETDGKSGEVTLTELPNNAPHSIEVHNTYVEKYKDFEFTKVWENADGKFQQWPSDASSIKVDLYAKAGTGNPEKIAEGINFYITPPSQNSKQEFTWNDVTYKWEVSVDASGTIYTFRIPDLPAKDNYPDGNDYEYSVVEQPMSDYETRYGSVEETTKTVGTTTVTVKFFAEDSNAASAANGKAISNKNDHSYVLTKVDADNGGRKLPGAVFTVYKYQKTGEEMDQETGDTTDVYDYVSTGWTYTTNEDGVIRIKDTDHDFKANTAYYIAETTAPTGYAINETKYPFWFYTEDEEVTAPDGFKDTALNLNAASGNATVRDELTGIIIKKLWSPVPEEGTSDSITVNVKNKNGDTVKTVTLTRDNGWEAVITDLTFEEGAEYTFEEESVTGYELVSTVYSQKGRTGEYSNLTGPGRVTFTNKTDTPDQDEPFVDQVPEATSSKIIEPNNDGTYTLTLGVTIPENRGRSKNKANVVIVFDSSNSMSRALDDQYKRVLEWKDPVFGKIGGIDGDSENWDQVYEEYRGYDADGRYVHWDYYIYDRNIIKSDGSKGWWVEYKYEWGFWEPKEDAITRMSETQDIVEDLGKKLLANNKDDGQPVGDETVELGFVEYATNIVQEKGPSGKYSDEFTQTDFYKWVAACEPQGNSVYDPNGGTNWEAALDAANRISFGDNDPTYIIFISDGNPTKRISGGNGTTVEQANIDAAKRAAGDIKGLNKFLFAFGVYGEAKKMKELTPRDAYYDVTMGEELSSKFDDIAKMITSRVGYTDVTIEDGLTSMSSSTLVSGTASNFTYKVQVPDLNEDGTQKVDGEGNPLYKDVTESALAALGNPEAMYTETPAVAADGTPYTQKEIVWDLGGQDLLIEGGTYSVSFIIWPSQEAYDLVADLNNGKRIFNDLNDVEKSQVILEGGVYKLKTNTHEGAHGKTATQKDDDPPVPTSPDEPIDMEKHVDPMPLTDTKVKVQKKWQAELDSSQLKDIINNTVVLDLYKETAKYIEGITISKPAGITEVPADALSSGEWIWPETGGPHNISAGLMVSTAKAEASGLNVTGYPTTTYNETTYHILEPGRDYSFKEAGTGDKHFELEKMVFHPMVVDDVLNDVFFNTDGSVKSMTPAAAENTVNVTAVNKLKGGIRIYKEVYEKDGTTKDEDNTTPFTVKVTMTNSDGTRYSVTAEDGGWRLNYGPNNPKAGEYNTEYGNYGREENRHAIENGEFTATLYPGDFIQVANVDSGVTYTVEEINIPLGYDLMEIVDGTGIVQTETSHQVTVKNKKVDVTTGNLNITKAVTEGADATGKTFTFEVTLTNGDGSAYTGKVKVIDSTRTTATEVTPDASGKVTVTISGKGTAIISEIPDGTKYAVTEKDLPDGWMQLGEVAITGGNQDKTIAAGEVETATVTNTNRKGFSFTKNWCDPMGSAALPWPDGKSITVNILQAKGESDTDPSVYAAYTINKADIETLNGEIAATNGDSLPKLQVIGNSEGTYTFKLDGLPAVGTEGGTAFSYVYYVREPDAAPDYQSPKYFNGTTQVMGATRIGDGGIIKNDQIGYELPSTGGPGTRLFTILGSILILGAGVLLWRRRRLI